MYELIGLAGAVLCIINYFLLIYEKVTPISAPYLLLNLIASLLVLISLFVDYNLSSIVLQVFFISISVYGLIKMRIKNADRE